jgi:cation transport ATPase
MRRLINDYQRRAMIAALLIAVILPVQSVIAIFAKNGPHSLGTDLDGWLVPAGFIFTAMLGVFVVCFGPIRMLSDELTRTLRARAAKLGFLLAVPGMSAVYLISLYKPEWGTVAAPPIIAAAVVLPALYYVFLDWRSGCRDG